MFLQLKVAQKLFRILILDALTGIQLFQSMAELTQANDYSVYIHGFPKVYK